MSTYLSAPCTAFSGTRRIASGALVDVALAIKASDAQTHGSVLTFDNASGAVIDLDLRGTTAEIIARLTEHGEFAGRSDRARGRPKLGVVAREVTLLPRHWEWLARQAGGASQALRRLVDEARRTDGGHSDRKAAQERTYRFLSALAGDLSGYEEAIRALFAGDDGAFAERVARWPQDIQDHALALAQPNLVEEQS
jgi:hypothetical protein